MWIRIRTKKNRADPLIHVDFIIEYFPFDDGSEERVESP
jgi:hypothetical protein